jgi:hypothetical protein
MPRQCRSVAGGASPARSGDRPAKRPYAGRGADRPTTPPGEGAGGSRNRPHVAPLICARSGDRPAKDHIQAAAPAGRLPLRGRAPGALGTGAMSKDQRGYFQNLGVAEPHGNASPASCGGRRHGPAMHDGLSPPYGGHERPRVRRHNVSFCQGARGARGI